MVRHAMSATQLLKSRVSVPNLSKGGAPRDLEKRKHQIAAYVRKGGFIMPFFTEDRLSDQDIADIVAFIAKLIEEKK